MTTRPDFERNVGAWLNATAGEGTPDYLDEIEVRVAVVRQRAWWSSLERWLPMDLTTRASTFARPRMGRALVVAILLIALLAAALVIVGSRSRVPAPFGPASTGAIVFSNGGDLYLSDGEADRKLLIGGSTVDVGPLYSHDGTKIAFLRQATERTFRYMLVRSDGTDLKMLTSDPLRDPDMWDWSPDGSRLVVQHRDGLMPVLSIVPSDGGGAVRPLDVGALEPDNPAWRPPDGQEIVFRGRSDGGSSSALYVIKPDGSGLRRITQIVPSADAYLASRLSPDGAAVTYTNFNEPGGSLDGVGGHVHVLDLRTGDDHRVADDQFAANETEPQFSPDGTLVLYRRYGLDVPMRLMLAPRSAGAPARQVGPAQDPDGDYVISFSPDGNKLFVSHQNGTPWQVITLADGSIQYGAAVDDWAHWQRLGLPAE